MTVFVCDGVCVCTCLCVCACRDAADKVVTGTGKFEELVVASHDIAASTAQLVAASRVKARPRSDKLKALKVSSRDGEEGFGADEWIYALLNCLINSKCDM